MHSVALPRQVNMTTTTTTGHPQMELSSSSVPRRRHPLYRGDMRTRDTQDPRFPARTHMQQGYTGYDGQYLQQCQGIIKPGQFHGMLKPSKANVPQRNEPPTRQHRAATSEIVRKRSDYVVRDEDLVGRPAMIALHQDDLQFDDVTELPRADRIDYGHKSRGSNQSDTLHGNSKSGTFHGNSKSGGFRGNCKSGGFRGNCKSSIPATKATTRQSRPRSGTTDNQVSREPQMVVAPIQGSSRSVQNDVSSLASGPAPLTSEPVAWRVALDPKSKKPYYYHRITRETTWKKPAELIAAETHEKRQFFNVMENNIRLKLRDGFYLRESDNTFVAGLHSPNTGFHLAELSSTLSTRSCTSTVSCNSSRSSLNSFSNDSTRSLPGSSCHFLTTSTRSLPTTPDRHGNSRMSNELPLQHNVEATDVDKRPSLFRTLSSYETPVMTLSRKERDSNACVLPSPIQERVRLAALMPRTADLQAYARAVRSDRGHSRPSLPLSTLMVPLASDKLPCVLKKPVVEHPTSRLRRSNSTNSIYLRMGTMDTPDQGATIQCVATVLRAHMMEALDDPIRSNACFDVFVTNRDRQYLPFAKKEAFNDASTLLEKEEDKEVMVDVVPTLSDIGTFIQTVLSRAQMESECIIMTLVYVERLLKMTNGTLQLRGENWRKVVFCAMVMASKVWDDLSMSNADFSTLWPEISLKQMNELEWVYLHAVEYNVRVSAASYAKYYFHLRSMCATMGLLKAFDESAPLNVDGARKMEVLSKEYQERAKVMPVPRRRSVTITSVLSMENRLMVENNGLHATKASPSASLEQLVQMQVYVAGGASLRA